MPIAANGAETFTDFIEELATISVTELYTRLWVQHTSDTELPLFEPTTLTHRDAEPVFVVVDTLFVKTGTNSVHCNFSDVSLFCALIFPASKPKTC